MALSHTALITLNQAKAYLRVNASASLKVDAEYVGMGDGSNKTFTLDYTPIEGSLKLYVNGVLQTETTDFTISDKTITFVTAPTLDYPVTASYDKVADANTFEAYEDDVLEKMSEAATKIAEDFIGCIFIHGEITENRIGNGDKLLSLHWQPIVSVSSVELDGTALTKDTDYIELLDMGWLKRSSGWTKDKAIVVVYTAGYASTRVAAQALLPNVMQAVLLIIADLYENRGDTIDSVNISGLGSISYKLPSRAERILNNLKPQGGFA